MTPNIATCPALLFRVATSRPFGILLPQSHLFGGPSHTKFKQHLLDGTFIQNTLGHKIR